ncbi:MAG TPA: YtxH domain-containing protein [Ktedonobacteraceae bacterium]|nr:YtxH domain-containing protein [Ktedonobacteraceae bacterium]
MGAFTNGLLVGIGVSLLFAPKKGTEMRSLVAERFRYLRGIPPENEELKQSVQDVSQRLQSVQQSADRAAQMGSTVQDYAQHTATQAASIQNDLSNVAQQAGTDVSQTTQGRNSPPKPPRPRP